MKLRTAFSIHAAIWLALQGIPGVAAPASASEALPPGSSASGGIGSEGQEEMRTGRALYNLRLTFAEATTGAYVAGVVVTIQPTGKKSFFGPYLDCGPLFHVALSPGSYEVTASYGGITRHKTVRVGTGATEATLYWPSSDESAAFGASLFVGRR